VRPEDLEDRPRRQPRREVPLDPIDLIRPENLQMPSLQYLLINAR